VDEVLISQWVSFVDNVRHSTVSQGSAALQASFSPDHVAGADTMALWKTPIALEPPCRLRSARRRPAGKELNNGTADHGLVFLSKIGSLHGVRYSHGWEPGGTGLRGREERGP